MAFPGNSKGLVRWGDVPAQQGSIIDAYAEGQDKLPGVLPNSSPEMPPEAIPCCPNPNKLPVKFRGED